MTEHKCRINRTLFELEAGILIFGVICQLLVFFLKNKAAYSLGLWIGILTAFLYAVHMWWSIDRALSGGQAAAGKTMSVQNIIRYFLAAAVVAVVGITKVADPLAVFLGIMGLKASAYMHVLTKHIATAFLGKEILPERIEAPVDSQDEQGGE